MSSTSIHSGTDGERRIVVALVADLLFASRIRGVASAVGVAAIIVRTGAELLATAGEAPVQLVLIDLAARGVDAADVIATLKSDPRLGAIPVVAFGPHTDRNALQAARAAGADRVLARSALVRDLPSLLRGDDGAGHPETPPR